MRIDKYSKLTKIAVFVSLGVVLQIADAMIIIPVNFPGGKLGLANLVNFFVISAFGPGMALIVAMLRAVLGGLLFGGVMTMLYALIGAIFSVFIMIVVKRGKLISFTGIGVLAAAAHNLGQVCLAAVLLKSTAVFSYMPVLLIISAISGAVIGWVGEMINAKNNIGV